MPTSTYVMVSTPLRGATEDERLEKSIALMDQFVGLLRSVTGNAFLRDIVREEVVSIPSGDMTAATPTMSLPHPSEGPYLSPQNWTDIEEMIKTGAQLPNEKKERFTLSCQLFDQAARSSVPTKFFLYWVAMEVLCKTYKAGDFMEILQDAYGVSKEHIEQFFGFKKLIRLRQDLFHQGKPHDIPQDVERYIQCAFLDLLRATLQLPCKKNLEGFIAGGFDVTRLDREIGRLVVETIRGDQPPRNKGVPRAAIFSPQLFR